MERQKTGLAAILGQKKLGFMLLYPDLFHFPLSEFENNRIVRGASHILSTEEVLFSEDSWPFPPHFFDVIVSAPSLEHPFNPHVFVPEARKALQESGCLIITGMKFACLFSKKQKKQSLLDWLSCLESQDFICQVQHFRVGFFPFMSRGFIIEAKPNVLPLTALPHAEWVPELQPVLNAAFFSLGSSLRRCWHALWHFFN